MTRYFRSTPAVYSGICSQLDLAYGYPNADTRTERALPLTADLPTDSDERVYLAVDSDQCDYILPSEMLPQLLSSGAVEEITEEAYRSVLPEPP